MINKRQENIIRDLKEATSPVTAKTLGAKYSVSTRTIRNDISVIEHVLQGSGMKFVRIRGQGMRIFATGKEIPLPKDQILCHNYYHYDLELRELLLILDLFLLKPPHRLQDFARHMNVSKGTITHNLEILKEFFKPFGAELVGIKNRGYVIRCQQQPIVLFNEVLRNNYKYSSVYSIIENLDNAYLSLWEKTQVKKVISFMKEPLYISVLNHDGLAVNLTVFFNQFLQQENFSPRRKEYPIKMNQLMKFIARIFKSNATFLNGRLHMAFYNQDICEAVYLIHLSFPEYSH
jgi:transcriptional antiterminator